MPVASAMLAGTLPVLPSRCVVNPRQARGNDEPDPVQDEEQHGLAADGRALAVPERPVPARDIGEGSRDHGGDHGRGEPAHLMRAETRWERSRFVPPSVMASPDEADDAELGALVNTRPEPLVQVSQFLGSAHRSGLRSSRLPRCYPDCRELLRCSQVNRARRLATPQTRASTRCPQDYPAARPAWPGEANRRARVENDLRVAEHPFETVGTAGQGHWRG